MRHRPSLILLAALAAAIATDVGAGPAGAAAPVQGVRFTIAMNNALRLRLAANCSFLFADRWREDPGRGPFQGLNVFATGSTDPGTSTGSYDAATGRGAAQTKGDALRLIPLSSANDGRHQVVFSDVGVELVRGRAYLTARLRLAAARSLAAPRRQRLAQIVRPALTSGVVHEAGKAPEPNTFAFELRGAATVLPGFATAVERTRCRGAGKVGPGHGPVRAGSPLGRVVTEVKLGAASGLEGSIELGDPRYWFSAGGPTAADDRVAVAFAGGPTTIDRSGSLSVRFAFAPGSRTPLACHYGTDCVPAGGAVVPLVGGFTLTYGGRTATIAGLTLTYTAPAFASDPPTATLAGTLDGAPVVIVVQGGDTEVEATPDFLARLGQAFGTTAETGRIDLDLPQFTTTGFAA